MLARDGFFPRVSTEGYLQSSVRDFDRIHFLMTIGLMDALAKAARSTRKVLI